jgi:GT2 family glycosyltransferase
MSNSFQIGIPTIVRRDLLIPTIRFYKSKNFKDVTIHIIDNGGQDLSEIENLVNLIRPEKNLGVAGSWNLLCKIIFENNNNALILNDDVCVDYGETLVNSMINKYKGFVRATPDWCAFILSKDLFNRVGKFDECFFPAYYEDKSYEYRMKLMGYKINKNPLLNPILYRSSSTLEKVPQILESSKKNKRLYQEMWGGIPNQEKYKKPYGK